MKAFRGVFEISPLSEAAQGAVRPLAVALVGVLGFTAGALLIDRALSVGCGDEPACPTLGSLKRGEPLAEAIHIHDREGALLANVAGPLRLSLAPGQIPDRVSRAFVAVEDRRFWEHGGVDLRGVGRALITNLRSGTIEQGASTIPMQLVRTLWAERLRDVGPWRRKIIEARTAPALVEALGHEGVLTTYLNAIYLGNGVYGIGAAARYYFDAPVDSLDVAQLATLVGMTRTPEYYEPRRHPERAKARRDVVLDVLAEEGVLTVEEAEAAQQQPLTVAPLAPARSRRSYLSAAITREIRRVAPELAGRPGIHVYTTIDARAQSSGEETLRAHLEALDEGRYGRLLPAPDGAPLQGAAVALDPHSGAIRAWIGGRDFDGSEFDRVEQARRPIGSLVKPFVVAHALERGLGILDLVSAAPSASEGWLPKDHVDATVLPLREVLIRSSNRASVHLGYDLGLDVMRDVGHRVGLEGPIPALPSTYVGAFEASLLEVTAAYAPFGNGGHRVEPHLVEAILDGVGDTLWVRRPFPSAPALPADVSWVVLDAMRDVVDRGTGYAARGSGYQGPAAGKTGTSDDVRDAWFVGVRPDLVAGVWIGYDTPSPTVPGGSGGTLAAPAWGRWMGQMGSRAYGAKAEWTPPAGVVKVRYDRRTGRAGDPACSGDLDFERVEAWIRDRWNVLERCRSGLSGFLHDLWRSVAPQPLEPVSLTKKRQRDGGG